MFYSDRHTLLQRHLSHRRSVKRAGKHHNDASPIMWNSPVTNMQTTNSSAAQSPIAQLGERQALKLMIVGSNPAAGDSSYIIWVRFWVGFYVGFVLRPPHSTTQDAIQHYSDRHTALLRPPYSTTQIDIHYSGRHTSLLRTTYITTQNAIHDYSGRHTALLRTPYSLQTLQRHLAHRRAVKRAGKHQNDASPIMWNSQVTNIWSLEINF